MFKFCVAGGDLIIFKISFITRILQIISVLNTVIKIFNSDFFF